MKTTIVIVLLLSGCTFFSETQQPDQLPELVYHTPLPPTPSEWLGAAPRLEVLFRVAKNGTVREVKFLTPTGSKSWESHALEEMKHWQFSPTRADKDTIPVWIHVPLRIRQTEPKTLFVEELVCNDRVFADSAYILLLAGRDIESIVKELSSPPSVVNHRAAGEIDLRRYSKQIQEELSKLRGNEFTKPIQMGDSFIIFRRLIKPSKAEAE